MTRVDRYSRNIANAVAVDAATLGSQQPPKALVYDGAGGDAFLLRLSPSNVSHPLAIASLASDVQPPLNAPYTLSTAGIVMDIDLMPDDPAQPAEDIYLATYRSGVEVFSTQGFISGPIWLAPADSEVRCVDAVDVPVTPVGGGSVIVRLVIAGTEVRTVDPQDTYPGGRLHILVHDKSVQPQTLDELQVIDVGRPVRTVAATADSGIVFGSSSGYTSNLAVLLGTVAATFGSYQRPLQRRDFLISVGQGSAVSSSQVLRQGWTTNDCTGTPKGMIIRDIVIDEPERRAYVAAHWDGVFAFDIDPGSLSPDPYWSGADCQQTPIRCLKGISPVAGTWIPDGSTPCQPDYAGDDPGNAIVHQWPIKLPCKKDETMGLPSAGPDKPWPSCATSPNCSSVAPAYAASLALIPTDPGYPSNGGSDLRLFVGWAGARLEEVNAQFLNGVTLEIPPPQSVIEPAEFSCAGSGVVTAITAYHLVGDLTPHWPSDPDFLLPNSVRRRINEQNSLIASPRALDVWFDGESKNYYLFIANGDSYMHVQRQQDASGQWSFGWTASWNLDEPAGLPGRAFDDGVVLSIENPNDLDHYVPTLFVAAESSLAAFPLSPAGQAPDTSLSQPACMASSCNPKNPTAPPILRKHTITIVGVDDESIAVPGDDGESRIFGSMSFRDDLCKPEIQFVNIENPWIPRPATASSGEESLPLSRNDFGYFLAIAPGLYDPSAQIPSAQDQARYLYSVNAMVKDSCGDKSQYGVILWDVGSASAPLDPTDNCSACTDCEHYQTQLGPRRLATFENSVPGVQPPLDLDRELSGAAVYWDDDRPDYQYLYALYCPRFDDDDTCSQQLVPNPNPPPAYICDSGNPCRGGLGLFVLEARLVGTDVTLLPVTNKWPLLSVQGQPPQADGYFEALGPLGGGPALDNTYTPGRVTIDVDRQIVYGVWTGALAAWNISDPADPDLFGFRDLSNEPPQGYGLPVMGPNGIVLGPTVNGRHYVYISFFNEGIGILDATDGQSFSTQPQPQTTNIQYFRMPWQTIGATLDPRSSARDTLFVMQGPGGVELVRFQ